MYDPKRRQPTAGHRIVSRRDALRSGLAGLPWLIGCAAPPPVAPTTPCFSHYRAPDLASHAVRRVAIVPLVNETDFGHAEPEFRSTLAAELRGAGLFEVMVVPDDVADVCRPRAMPQGAYDEQFLVELAHRFQADAVLLGSLRDYQPYWPPRLGVTVHLVSTREAIPLASVDGMWDARQEDVAVQAQQFYCRLTLKQVLPQSELVLYAPHYYGKFVAHQIVEALAGRWG